MGLQSRLIVLHDDNGSFVDHTEAAEDFLRDNFTMTLIAADDYVYLGLYKPFGSVYAEVYTANTQNSILEMEYWNGTAWTALELRDQTNGLKRSGFMSWDKDNMKATTVNSVASFYVRIKPDIDTSAVTLRGLNLIFADDHDLKQEFLEITNSNLLPPGETSHIGVQVATRNFIIQDLRNRGYIKYNDTTGYESLTPWDLHDMSEIRQAAVFMTLAKIFFNLSDSPDDIWWMKYRSYMTRFEEAMKIAHLSLDDNDDGVVDISEDNKNAAPFRWNR
jgi:hypothetical protein